VKRPYKVGAAHGCLRRNLIGDAAIAGVGGGIAWIAAFFSTGNSWVVAVVPAVGLSVAGIYFFLVALLGRWKVIRLPKLTPPWRWKAEREKKAQAEQAEKARIARA
jgi:phosphotransferase system  glucose/maltose/N-acetylglucosamine-specific IIC component